MRKITGGETHLYRIAVEAGQLVRIVAEQKGADVVLKLIGPAGAPLTEVDSPSGTEGPESLSEVADAAGEIRIEVSVPDSGAKPGEYEIRIDVGWPTKRTASGWRPRGRLPKARSCVGESGRRRRFPGMRRAAELWHSLNERAGEAMA